MHAALVVERDGDGGGDRSQAPISSSVTSRPRALPGCACGPAAPRRFRCAEVGEDVVVDQRGVFVRTGDAVDVEHSVATHIRAHPESGGLDEDLEPTSRSKSASPVDPHMPKTAAAISALMWNAAVPAGQYPSTPGR